MGLKSIGGKLLAIAGRLKDACCCRIKEYDCVTTGVDSCGRSIVECQKVPYGGNYYTPNCDTRCPLPIPCECTPPCDGCSKCIDGVCVPDYGPCEQCVNGSIQPKCGECELCIDGTCVPCPEGYTCVNGVCCSSADCPPPGTYYCCYEYEGSGSSSDPTAGVTGTYCFNGPCGEMINNVFVPQAWRTAGGPYDGPLECEDHCRKHNCTPDACNNYACEPDEAGLYLTKELCNDNCDDPTGGQCSLIPENFTASGSGAGAQSYFFTVGPAAFTNGRAICVTYASTTGRPIRVQIYSPDMASDGCTQIASRTIKGDSQWRCQEECSCGFDAPGGCKGAPKGFVKWTTKQKNVTTFEVRVSAECADNEWQIGVTCGPCIEMPEIDCCCGPCELDGAYDEFSVLGDPICDEFVPVQTLYGLEVGLNTTFEVGNQGVDGVVVAVSDVVNQAAMDEYTSQCFHVLFWADVALREFGEERQDLGGRCCVANGASARAKLRAFVQPDCESTLEDKSNELLTQTVFESFDFADFCGGAALAVAYSTPKNMNPTCHNPLL